jgi:biotin-dependent carboxylase-like uncharacterized protein
MRPDPTTGRSDRPSAAPILEVIEPGLLTTVQDAGRPGLRHLGVPEGGAADRRSLAIANLLAGNDVAAAALECTLLGPVLRVLQPALVALGGADLDARIVETGARVKPGSSLPVRPGTTLSLAGPSRRGARAYLAVAGGIAVDPVLGSRSTALGAGFGGVDGRALRAGDVLSATLDERPRQPGRWPEAAGLLRRPVGSGEWVIRIAAGPHASDRRAADADDGALGRLRDATWRVSADADRMGIRLDGPGVPIEGAGDIATIPVLTGSIQVPPDGMPIILLTDAQPTGGYPVPAVVIRADLPTAGQLRPGDAVRFEVVSSAEAAAILRADRARFEAAAAHLAEAAGWDELWRGASG